ncbi:hypothetical protein [Kriegella aquimaris]|uniref:Uncharacterized protein n=1 Tax=Kriegella aquimaris TaxID=192904 RepID=A0A1G9TNT1_9FLAO|nr:hypothetical protein [Kriegella aquimaris]SDM49353.1 hypothetical protein SAMN04488514_109141 [Kriegella aquimaris]
MRFKPFDFSGAGVNGSDDWKELAKFDPELSHEFDDMDKIIEQRTNWISKYHQ